MTHLLQLLATGTPLLTRIRRLLILSILLSTILYMPACKQTTTPPAATPKTQAAFIPYTDLTGGGVGLSNGDRPNETPADQAVRGRLEENLKEISAENQGFEKIIQFLRENTNTNISVNWTALQLQGIDRNTPVTVSLKEIPLRKALTTILNEVGGDHATLGYVIDHGVITISTQDDLESPKYLVGRVYDIRELIAYFPPSPPPAITPGPPILPSDLDPIGQRAHQERADEIKNTITSTVAPDSWRDNGGKVGSIRELNGLLIINQTVDNQRAVYQLLCQLREGRSVRINVNSRILLLEQDAFDRVVKKFLRPVDKRSQLPFAVFDAKQAATFAQALQTENPTLHQEQNEVYFDGSSRCLAPFTALRPFVSSIKQNSPTGHPAEIVKEYSTITAGIFIRNEMTISADHQNIVAKSSFITRHLRRLTPAPAPGTPAAQKLEIEVPDLTEETLSDLLSIPDGATVVVAGPAVPDNFPQKKNKRILLLFTPKITIVRPASAQPPANASTQTAGEFPSHHQ